jgi:hypothetical protein
MAAIMTDHSVTIAPGSMLCGRTVQTKLNDGRNTIEAPLTRQRGM